MMQWSCSTDCCCYGNYYWNTFYIYIQGTCMRFKDFDQILKNVVSRLVEIIKYYFCFEKVN